MLREEKGITLVALIITIIVLIILAAVTIMSFKDSKLINTAVNGAVNYANAQEYEMKSVNYTVDLLDERVTSIEAIQAEMLSQQAARISASISEGVVKKTIIEEDGKFYVNTGTADAPVKGAEIDPTTGYTK